MIKNYVFSHKNYPDAKIYIYAESEESARLAFGNGKVKIKMSFFDMSGIFPTGKNLKLEEVKDI